MKVVGLVDTVDDGFIVGDLGERVFVGSVVFAAGLIETVDLTVGRLDEGARVGIFVGFEGARVGVFVGFVGPEVVRFDGVNKDR